MRGVARLTGLLSLAAAGAPETALACAVCLDSAWGQRGFGWPFVALMAAPFAVVAGLVGVLAWIGWRPPPPDPRRAAEGAAGTEPSRSR